MNNLGIAITATDIVKRFNAGKTVALDHLSLNFAAGMLHGVIGPAGAGKTTLLRILLTLMQQDTGNVTYRQDGKPIDFATVMTQIAYMPEKQSLYADLSIQEHLDFFASMYGLAPEHYAERREMLLKVTRLEKFLDRPAGKLSGGMYKKLGLMCSLLRSPRVILLDEPTNGVDPISRREFWEILNNAVKEHITVIMTTAYMDEAERCEQVHLLENGRCLGSGEPTKLLHDEQVENFDEYFIKRAAAHITSSGEEQV